MVEVAGGGGGYLLLEAEVVAEVEEDLVAEAVRWQVATAAAAASSAVAAVVAPSVVVEAAAQPNAGSGGPPVDFGGGGFSRTPAAATLTAGLISTMPVCLSSSHRRRPLERAPQQTVERRYPILNGSIILFRRSVRERQGGDNRGLYDTEDTTNNSLEHDWYWAVENKLDSFIAKHDRDGKSDPSGLCRAC